MHKIEISDDIHIYKNFISKEECSKTLNSLLEYAESDAEFWKGISFYESYSSGYPNDGDEVLKKHGLPTDWFSQIEDRFRECASLVAKTEKNKMSKISFHIQRWLPGAFANKHSDNTTNDGVYGAFTRSRYAGFLYLNDDFEGGILKFYADYGKNEFEVTPEPGMFIVFHGGHKNLHEVTIVKHGNRYTIGSFWDDREEADYSEDLRQEWAKELAEVRAMQKEEQKEWNALKEKNIKIKPNGQTYPAEEVN